MFQSFDVLSDRSQARPRIEQLRAKMRENRVDAFLVPRADEHQGEYVAARAERLKWLTGFTGSAGAAVVLEDRAIVFVDGRYRLQVREQVDTELFSFEDLVESPPAKWIGNNAEPGWRIGFDPWLHTIGEADRLRKAAQKRGAELIALGENLVDLVWDDQPARPSEPVELHPLELAGEPATTKLEKLATAVADADAAYCVLTDPSSFAWAFNIRGHDVAHTPLALGFAVIAAAGRHLLFIDPVKLNNETRTYLSDLARIEHPDRMTAMLSELAAGGTAIGLDSTLAAERLRLLVEDAGGKVVAMTDPASLPRAAKNDVELGGSRAAHRRDGAAVSSFLHWLDSQEPGAIDEIGAATQLEAFRASTAEALQTPLQDIAFDTISGAGPNGAIIHYRVTTVTNRRLGAGELYLVDSGGQYRDGTTDITRTVAVGKPTDDMRMRYTIVLKGLIAISRLRFPPGTRGQDIDAFARHAHWQAGIDYAHGTGHGVGSFLSVHEGPQRIAKSGSHKLHAGMILSNEPGYYREGHYGIRLENLIVVTPAEAIAGGEIDMHGFETLTLVPFDRRLIETGLLDKMELKWIDAYHARVAAEIGPLVEDETRSWLAEATAPLSH